MDNQTLVNFDKNTAVALKTYYKHLERVRKYQHTHPEKVAERNKKHYNKIKDDPEKYGKYLQYCREYGKRTRKEKKIANLNQIEQSPTTTSPTTDI